MCITCMVMCTTHLLIINFGSRRLDTHVFTKRVPRMYVIINLPFPYSFTNHSSSRACYYDRRPTLWRDLREFWPLHQHHHLQYARITRVPRRGKPDNPTRCLFATWWQCCMHWRSGHVNWDWLDGSTWLPVEKHEKSSLALHHEDGPWRQTLSRTNHTNDMPLIPGWHASKPRRP